MKNITVLFLWSFGRSLVAVWSQKNEAKKPDLTVCDQMRRKAHKGHLFAASLVATKTAKSASGLCSLFGRSLVANGKVEFWTKQNPMGWPAWHAMQEPSVNQR